MSHGSAGPADREVRGSVRKIPTLFRRNPDDRAHVLLGEVTPGCEWVVAGAGVPTRKVDGTCVMFDGSAWWARREIKPGRTAPPGFVEAEHDPTTGKTVGWEPIESSPFVRFWREALASRTDLAPGTFELVGPKINGNPEGRPGHELISHVEGTAIPPALAVDTPERAIATARQEGWEGIVWHHPDGRMAKLKVRDLPRGEAVGES